MEPRTKSAIMWFIWSIGVCIFAVFIASHYGAFDMVRIEESHPLSEPQEVKNFSSIDSEAKLVYSGAVIKINESQMKKIECAFRFGMC
jgi:hypothetical protein